MLVLCVEHLTLPMSFILVELSLVVIPIRIQFASFSHVLVFSPLSLVDVPIRVLHSSSSLLQELSRLQLLRKHHRCALLMLSYITSPR